MKSLISFSVFWVIISHCWGWEWCVSIICVILITFFCPEALKNLLAHKRLMRMILVLILQPMGRSHPAPACLNPTQYFMERLTPEDMIFPLVHRMGGMGGRGRVSWIGGLMSTYGAAESIDGSALGLSPLTYKEALFRRCFNPKWQCPPPPTPRTPRPKSASHGGSAVATDRLWTAGLYADLYH